MEHVLKGYAVQLYNNLKPEFPTDTLDPDYESKVSKFLQDLQINYDYYIKKTWEIIWEIEGTNLSLF